MRQKFVNKSICNISSGDFASYRDKRLQKVKPATLLRELCIIQHLYSIANKEWGFNLIDPVQRIRKPSLNNKRESVVWFVGSYQRRFGGLAWSLWLGGCSFEGEDLPPTTRNVNKLFYF